jgi:hypothetical protein
VDGCVGVEFPLVMPTKLVAANTSLLEAYTGMFGRIVASKLKLKIFWLWTNEGVQIRGGPQNGKGKPQADPIWAQLMREVEIALEALRAVGAEFELGVNGWCVGPGDNATFFDHVDDPGFSVSSINGDLGWLPPDPAFGDMGRSRSKFVIPWMEDDTSLASAQLWVNRTLDFAAKAHAYSANGLLGLTWRTWEVAPQVSHRVLLAGVIRGQPF